MLLMDMASAQTVLLGLAQGLTEFIPVSSSGHLVIIQHVMSGASDHLFLEYINIGTLLALIVHYRHKIVGVAKDIFEHKNYSLFINIILTSIPAGLAGFFLADAIENSRFFGSLTVVLITLTVVGVLMIVLDKLPRLSKVASGESLSWKRALGIGIAQMCALVPGVSRSGSTIIAGRIAGLSHRDAAEYSFLASLPIMIAVTLKLLISSDDRLYFVENAPMLLLGNLIAFIAGLLAIRFLLNYLSKHGLGLFGWYRLGLAGIVSVVLLVQYLLQ